MYNKYKDILNVSLNENYQKDKEYNLKYATTNGETKEIKFTPEKDMSTPEMIMKLKTNNKDFFKLLEESKERLVEDMKETIKSNTGFYIGDPCYVLPDEIYDEIWGNTYGYEDGKIDVDEFSFLVHGTAWGDGEYFDNSGISYGVDSGTLSVIPIELLENNEFIEEGEHEYGRIIFGKTASLNYEDGTFYFNIDNDNVKEVVIDTDLEEPEDDNWDEDEFPEDYWNNEDIYNDEEEEDND